MQLRLSDGSGRTAAIQQCIHVPASTEEARLQESSIAFHVVLPGRSLLCRIFLVYDVPQLTDAPGAAAANGGSSAAYNWRLVSRAHCARGCKGPLLATSRRLSGLGKRSFDSAGSAEAAQGAKFSKDMFVSIDEACTHCGASAFRLVAAIYDQAPPSQAAPASSGSSGGQAASAAMHQADPGSPLPAAEKLLATAVSPLIKVLANNDTPTGPGRIPLEALLPDDWEGWEDPTDWRSSLDSLVSSAFGKPPASSTPPPPRRLARSSRSEPSQAAAMADSGSAGSKPPSPRPAAPTPAAPAVVAAPAAPASAPARMSWPDAVSGLFPQTAGWQLPQQQQHTAAECLRSGTPVLLARQAQPVVPVGGTAGAAPPSIWPFQGHQLPNTEAAEAAVAAAWRQRQRARQAAVAEPAPMSVQSVQGTSELASQQHSPPAAQMHSRHLGAAARLLMAQGAAGGTGSLAGTEAMLTQGGQAIVTQVPGGYRVVRVAGTPAASPSPSPFGPRHGIPAFNHGNTAAASYGDAAGQLRTADAARAQWSSPAPPLPPDVAPPQAASFSWPAEQQASDGSSQQGAFLLPPEAYDATAVRPAAPAAPAQPAQRAELPLPTTASLASSSAAGTAGAWGDAQWGAYQSAAVRQVDMQLVAAGLAAAGRLGLLLPSAARQQATAGQQAWHSHSTLAAQGDAGRGALGSAAGAGQHGMHMPDLPSEAQLLSLMADRPSEFDSMASIFDDIILPH